MGIIYRVGTSGWLYNHWGQGVFYPTDLPKSRWFPFYAHHFDTVELNSTFYRLPPEKTFQGWRQKAPAGFCYALKASRFITHIKRLRDCVDPLETFLSRARAIGESHLGPILYQLPPGLHRDDRLLEDFLRLVPADLQHAFEFRHKSWFHPQVLDLLQRHGVGFCVQDMPRMDCPVAATTSFAYFRFHGAGTVYSGNYSDDQLRRWAEQIQGVGEEVSQVFIYFNNDLGGHAVRNAKTLRSILQG